MHHFSLCQDIYPVSAMLYRNIRKKEGNSLYPQYWSNIERIPSTAHFLFSFCFLLHLSNTFFQASLQLIPYVIAYCPFAILHASIDSFTQSRALPTVWPKAMKIFNPLAIKLACFGVLILLPGQDTTFGKAGIVYFACVGINSNFVQITKFPEGFLKMKFCKQASIFHWGISYILGNDHTLDPFLTQSKLNPIV